MNTPGFGINRFPKIEELLFTEKLRYIVKKVIRELGKPDIVHAHSCLWAGYSAIKVFNELEIPVVITEHSTEFPKNELYGYRQLCVEDCINKSQGMITVSNGLKQCMSKYNYNNKAITVIPNMFSNDLFSNQDNIKKDDKFKFIAVCYLTRKKGLDILIKSFAKSFKGNYDVELLIGGQGQEYNNLVNLAKEINIYSQVKFLGDLSRENVVKYIKESDVFVLPSRFETFGVVFIEALALGKPIIASRCGGPEDIVKQGNGLLVEVEDIDGLSKAMQHMYNEYEKYNHKDIIKDCNERFSENAVMMQLENYYLETIKNYNNK